MAAALTGGHGRRGRVAGGLSALAVVAAAGSGVPVATAQEVQPPPAMVDWEPSPPDAWPSPPPATARAYLLMDVDTGQVLADRAADEPRLVASTVKLLTIITALQELSPDQTVTVGPEADPGDGGAGASVDPGEQWTVADLLDAIIVRSGNDAARALAGAVTDGDLDAFTERMRRTAAALGVDEVVLTEPTGLDDGNMVSARALGTIARAALADPRIRAAAGQDAVDLPDLGTLPNRNLLVGRYPGTTGLKTGYTDASGWCLVASAERGGRELVAVVLGADEDADRFDEAAALLDHGFETLAPTDLAPLEARTAGAWHQLAPGGPVWAPAGVAVDTPLSGTAAGLRLAVQAGDEVLGARSVDVPAPDPPGVGAALVDAMYRGMRAAHRTGRWPDPGSSDTREPSSG